MHWWTFLIGGWIGVFLGMCLSGLLRSAADAIPPYTESERAIGGADLLP